MRNTLFNSEVEGFTYEKYSTIKLTIVVVALFATFTFLGWVMNVAGHVVTVMDLVADEETKI